MVVESEPFGVGVALANRVDDAGVAFALPVHVRHFYFLKPLFMLEVTIIMNNLFANGAIDYRVMTIIDPIIIESKLASHYLMVHLLILVPMSMLVFCKLFKLCFLPSEKLSTQINFS